ncbi:putative ribonuclease H-like domain-containing protein [Tanacetum coccineum]
MSFDDLYNNFKIVKQEVKKTGTSSLNSSSQNMAFVSTPSCTNDVNTANVQVSTASSSVSTNSTQDSTASLSDATVYTFLANQPNGSQLVHEDLEQMHEDDLEEMDLKWQLALLSMRARKYHQRTRKKITINGSHTAGYDKSKVECFNCHKMGHFSRECRGPRNQESRPRNQDSSRRTVNVEDASSKAMVAINGAVFDWSFMAEEEVTRNMVLMAFSDFEVYNDKTCSNTCLKSFEALKIELDNLRVEFNKSEFNLATYKKGLASVKEQLVFYKKNEVMFCDQIVVLKRDALFKDSGTSMLLKMSTSNEVKTTPATPLVEELVSEKETQTGNPPTDDQAYVDRVRGGEITSKGTLKTGKLDFQDVFFVKELQFKNFSVSQMCDKKNRVLFTDIACFVLSPDFKLPDESQILLKIPRKNNMYSVDMKNIVPKECLTCLFAKATLNESMLWHRRLGHISFKTINKLVKDNLVRGLPSKHFENDQTCVACLKGKQHKASSSKDEPSGILKNFITEIENLVDKKVKIIRCDNGIEFKDRVMNEFYEQKGIKREYTIARTPQQNGVAERRNRTLIEAARTMLADSKLPTTFWAEAVNTACYVQNMVIIVKPHNKTPYEVFRGRTPALNFMRPFGCHVSILNTLDHLGKFDGKSDDGFFVGYSLTSKAFRVYNIRTRRVEENLHIRFLEDKPIILGDGSEVSIGEGSTSKETDTIQDYIVMPLWKDSSLFDSHSMNVSHDEPEASSDAEKKDDEGVSKATKVDDQERPESSTPNINTVGPSVNTASANPRTGSLNINTISPTVITTRSHHPQSISDIFSLRDNVTPEASNANLFGDETKMDMSNLNASYQVPTTPNTRIHKDHSLDHVIGDIQSGVETKGMTKTANEQGFLSAVYEGKTHEDLHTCMFFCFLSEEEPKRVTKALSDPSWVEAMQEELLQFKLQKVWVLVDLPKEKRAIGTKWIFINKKDKRGIIIRNKARLVAQGYTQEEGFMVYKIDVKHAFLYGQIEEEVYVFQPPGFEDPDYSNKVYKVVKALYGLHQAPRAWYETLAKYLLDNGFHRGKIDQTLFIKKQKGGILLVQIYVDDIIFGSTKKELCLEFEKLMHDKFQMSSTGELTFFFGLQVKQKEDGIFISQDKYVTDILKKFGFQDIRTTSTPMDTEKPLLKDSDSDDIDVHLYRSMIGSLLYLTSSRLNIMFACKKQTVVATYSTKAEYVAAASCCGQVLWIQNQMLDYGYNFMHTMINIDNNILFEERLLMSICSQAWMKGHVGDEVVHKELGDRMEKAATIASSFEAEQDSDAQTRFETTSKQSNDPPFSRVNTLRSGEDNMKLMELMAHYTTLSELVRKRIERFSELKNRHRVVTTEDGVRGITATIDRKVKVFISETSIRRHLKLEDSDGISSLPTVEIFEQLALMRASKGYSGVDILLFPTMLTTPESSPSKMTSSPSLSPQTHPSTSQPPSTPQSNQTTPVTEEATLMPHESPLQSVYLLGRDEGSLSLNELTNLCTSLSKKVESLESELKQTKQTYHVALTKLIKRVKKLEQTIKISQAKRRAKVVISDAEENKEDPSKQGRSLTEELDLDARISLVPPHAADQGRIDDTHISAAIALANANAARRRQSVENVQTYIIRRRESIVSRLVSTADVSTASELGSTAGVKAKDKGKAIMQESEPPKKIKKRVQVQMSVDEELAKKLGSTTGNKSYLSDYEEIDGGFVAFGGDPKGGKITGKGKISTGKLGFKDVYFVKELKFNLFSVSQMCDNKNNVLFTNTECVVLSPDFELLDENQVLLRVPRKDNMYSVDLKNIVPLGDIENLIDLKVKVIRCDNGTEFKNKVMNQFCEMKGIKRAFSVARTPQQNGEPRVNQEKDANVNSTNNISTASDRNNTNNANTVSSTINVTGIEDNAAYENIVYGCDDDPNMPNLEEIAYSDDDEDVGVEADMNNLNTFMPPKKVIQALQDSSWIEAMQEELLQFKLQQVWTLVDLPHGKRAIGTKWVYRNKKDERGIVIRNKAKLVAQGYTQEEGIDYDEVFAPVARIKAIRLFLAYASFKDFVVYQMDAKSAFMYGKIEEEVYVCQLPRFEDPEFPDRVYKVEKALYGLHQAPRAWKSTIRGCQFLGSRLISWQCKKQTVVANYTTEAEATEISQSSGPIPLVADETVIKEWEDRMERAVTTASSLEGEQDSDTILGGAEAQIRFEAASKQSNDPPISRVNTLGSGEDSMKLKELMELYTKLSDRVLALENTNNSQAAEIATLKERVKKLEKKRRSITYKPRILYKGRKIADLDADTKVTLIDETQGRDDEDLMFDTGVLNGDEVFQEPMVNTATTTSSIPVSVVDPVTTAGEVVTTASVEILEELTLA